jgi:cyanophycinase-like exopeptidase
MKFYSKLLTTLFCCLGYFFSVSGQTYTSYFTGNTNDVITSPAGGVCLMGGSTEDDEAMKWFLNRANGGDVLVLRASGSDGYNNYFYSTLGVTINSVETIVFDDAAASLEPYIQQKIQQAEAIWFAGGNQWKYVSYWRNTAIDSLINEAITSRNIVIGGTSAGMAIMGGFYFSAQNGTVTSAEALNDPYYSRVTVDSSDFINSHYLANVITDTHYDDPDRKGRHVTFLARILTDYGISARGIACDEYTAVCIDTSGLARVFGLHPTYNDNAYFLQTNCELPDMSPEMCAAGNALDWNRDSMAVKVYAVKGTSTGSNTFDLNDWKTGSGGIWQHWYVDQGVFMEMEGTPIDCDSVSSSILEYSAKVRIFPNPSDDYIKLEFEYPYPIKGNIVLTNTKGDKVKSVEYQGNSVFKINVSDLSSGLYLLHFKKNSDSVFIGKVILD